MQLRRLGKSGLEVAPIAFGGNVFGWTVDDAMASRLLDRFVDAGFNLIDTADVYSAWVPGHEGGESESMLGRWLAKSGRRDDVLIATKVGMEMGSGAKGLSQAHIERSIDGSLHRLQTDHVDLYQAHQDDPTVPIEESLDAFARLISDQKVRAIGASNFTAPRLLESLGVSRARGLPPYTTLQPRYNLVDRTEYERELAAVCVKEDLGVLPYAALASGFLTGKYRSRADLAKSPRGRRVERLLDDRGMRIVQTLDQIARELGSHPASVAIAWLLTRPGEIVPIASATSVQQLDEVLAGAELRLPPEAVRSLVAASDPSA